MSDQETRLVEELETLRRRVAELEAAQAELQERYRDLFEHTGDAIFVVDPATRRILDANANAARRLCYTREELRQMTLDEIEATRGDPSGTLVWKSQAGDVVVFESVYRDKHGAEILVEVSGRVAEYGGRQVIQNFVRDITARKQVEAEREQLIVELSAYARMVAFDLINPVAVVVSAAEWLAADFESLDHERIRLLLKLIVRNGQKMRNIIDAHVLLASVRDLDEAPVEPLDMAKIVTAVRYRLAFLIEERGAELVVPDRWPAALGYTPWVEEVWVNYISNAVKYGGASAAAPRVELGAAVEPGALAVRFWVRDNGPGIAPEVQDRLFTYFTSLEEAQVSAPGLGLPIVKRIVEKLGGAVAVASVAGEGSEFSFTLPAAGAERVQGDE